MMKQEECDLLITNLKDADCDRNTIERFLDLHENDKLSDQISLLECQRYSLLTKIHKYQEQLDCLDYLLFTLNKQNKGKSKKVITTRDD